MYRHGSIAQLGRIAVKVSRSIYTSLFYKKDINHTSFVSVVSIASGGSGSRSQRKQKQLILVHRLFKKYAASPATQPDKIPKNESKKALFR